MMSATPLVRVQAEDFDLQAESLRLTEGRKDVGALVTFTGLCRDEAGTLAALELEHYPGMAEAELTRIAREAAERWPLTGLTAASSHRRAAFEAADFLMDYLKTRAPFWKKEHPAEGGTGAWVEAKTEDDTDAARWT